jgi:hypothetical protein
MAEEEEAAAAVKTTQRNVSEVQFPTWEGFIRRMRRYGRKSHLIWS